MKTDVESTEEGPFWPNIDYFAPLFIYIFQYAEDGSLMNHPASCLGPSALPVSAPLCVWFVFCVSSLGASVYSSLTSLFVSYLFGFL